MRDDLLVLSKAGAACEPVGFTAMNLILIFVYILALVCGVGYEIMRDENLR